MRFGVMVVYTMPHLYANIKHLTGLDDGLISRSSISRSLYA